MEKFEKFEVENLEMVLGGEFWETGCDNDKPTDLYDDSNGRLVVFDKK